MPARLHLFVQRNTVIENVAVALPLVAALIGLLKIPQNAALELEDVVEALVLHEHRRLFTADTAGAEHGDFLVFLSF